MLLVVVLPATGTQVNAQAFVGDYSGHTVAGRRVEIHAGEAAVRLVSFRDDIIRVDFLPSAGAAMDSSLAVVADTLNASPFTVIDSDSSLVLTAGDLAVVCAKYPLRLSFEAQGVCLLEEPREGGLCTMGGGRAAIFRMAADEHFYGGGERATALDQRGQVLSFWNQHEGGYTTPPATMGVNVPFIVSPRGWGLFFDTTYRGVIDLGSSDPGRFSFEVEAGELSFHVMSGATIPTLIEAYTWLTGRQPLPPLWAFGFIQSKYGYRNEVEARDMVRIMREKRIPCDAIVLDLYWFRHMGDLAWNSAAWPNPFTMMRDFKDQGIHTIAITEPYIVEHSPNFALAAAQGFLARTASGQPYRLHNWWSCGCDAGLLDVTNPAAQAWWWAKHPAFFGGELGGIWTDLGEPERHPDDMVHAMGSARKVHNVFNLLWAKAVFDGFAAFRPDVRLFNLTRAGSAGIQRFGVIPWSGDVGTGFGGLAVQLPMSLSMGVSGLAYHNSDIGGFCCSATSPELYVRWMQYGAFCPVTRAHGVDYQPQEPWGYGVEAEQICRRFLELRYRLIPYIYTMARANHDTGLPMARPLFFLDPEDPRLMDESSGYLWGDAFLVWPVVEDGVRSSRVYLPQGSWYDFWTDSIYQGPGDLTVPSPLETMPLFVKAGSIIPMWPPLQTTAARPADTLALAVYPGVVGGRGVLYEDDGYSLQYQHGAYALTEFAHELVGSGDEASLLVDIGSPRGSYGGQAVRRAYLVTVHGVTKAPSRVRRDGIDLCRAAGYDDLLRSGEGWAFDPAGLLHVVCDLAIDQNCRIEAESLGVAIHDSPPLPGQFWLRAYPNPYSSTTTISFGLPSPGNVRLVLYDAAGHELAVLEEGEHPAGTHGMVFDADSVTNRGPSNQAALCRLVVESPDEAGTRRVLWTGTHPLIRLRTKE